MGYIVTERFDNLKCIKDVKAPTWLLHGKEDEIISYNHSIKLKDNTKTFTVLNLQDNMTHNYFDLYYDLIINLEAFINKINLKYDRPQDKISFKKFDLLKQPI